MDTRQEFSFRRNGTSYHVATGIDCDGAYYLYTEGVHDKPTHTTYPNHNTTAQAFDACVSSIVIKEHLGV